MNKQKKNQDLSTIVKNQKKSDGLWRNGIVIDTTDEAFSGGIILDFSKFK